VVERLLRITQLEPKDEFLNGEIFYLIKELRVLPERWRVFYDTIRPHLALGDQPPAPEA
jgi:putative transposase